MWNKRALPGKYYHWNPKDDTELPRTRYQWKFAEKQKLDNNNSLSKKNEKEPDEDERQAIYKRGQKEKKDYIKYKDMVEEELVPKATGREAMIEKRRQKGSYAKARDDSPEMRDSDLMGGGSDFQSMLKRKKERERKKEEGKKEEMQQRLQTYNAKEEEKMQIFRDMIAAGNIPLLQPRPP
eukprot:TRINITY_DN496_c0_g1_i5.p1 TRINITY_DN496_c0_g1~~TRINITY_DN496_c0_g1_i5.p1  ORF type:complete len:181 (+),score=52.78 TRINITY_DN496_c0_g1_i5:415-957(+)